jgi:hypothetical protein
MKAWWSSGVPVQSRDPEEQHCELTPPDLMRVKRRSHMEPRWLRGFASPKTALLTLYLPTVFLRQEKPRERGPRCSSEKLSM